MAAIVGGAPSAGGFGAVALMQLTASHVDRLLNQGILRDETEHSVDEDVPQVSWRLCSMSDHPCQHP